MARDITAEEQTLVADMVAKARAAMAEIADYDQRRVDRLAQAIGWALGNETTFTRLAHMSVDESGIGDRDGRAAKRFKIHGILRDALRTQERRRHRGGSRQGTDQVRQARRGDRLDRADDEPGADPAGDGDLRDQGARRGHLLAPPADQANDRRGGPHPARGDGARRRAGRRVPVRRAAVDTAVPTTDGRVRPDAWRRAGRRWSRRRTAPASRPSASAVATRRW